MKIIKATIFVLLATVFLAACGGSSSTSAPETEVPISITESIEAYPDPSQVNSPSAAYPSPLEQTFDLTGTFAAGVKVSDGSRDVTLVVHPSGEATMTIQKPGGAGVVQTGTWQGDGRYLIVAFNKKDGESYTEDYTFELVGSQLVATIYDQLAWSEEGLVLSRAASGEAYP